jgi:hypothetical protein
VLGAGGCRFAYDLYREFAATETAVLDIDPFLFIVAEAVASALPSTRASRGHRAAAALRSAFALRISVVPNE